MKRNYFNFTFEQIQEIATEVLSAHKNKKHDDFTS
jgi:hypothetical protein